MTTTLATLPLDLILSISAFLSNPLDVLSLSHTCRSAFLASQASASYWSKLVPAAHLSRPAPWHSYSLRELRDAHIRYAATHRRWESPSPTFKSPIRLPLPHGLNVPPQHWRLIRGTRWAWSLQPSTGEVSFCDLRSGLVIGEWSARGPVIEAYIESRSLNECVLCHWKTNQGDNTSEFEIVATSVTFEQKNLISPIELSFRTTQRTPVEKGFFLSSSFPCRPMVLWRDYWIGLYCKAQPKTGGLFLWSMTENTIFYFQMGFVPDYTKFIDDILLVTYDGTHWNNAFRCIHIPSLVISAQLPGGSLSLTASAFAVLFSKYIMASPSAGSLFPVHYKIYSIPACSPRYPRYCFIIKRLQPVGLSLSVWWEVFEAEIDLSIPGPIKIFSSVSSQYMVQHPSYPLQDSDEDLLLYVPLGRRGQLRAPPMVRFLRVGKPDKLRVATLGGVDKMRLSGLTVDKDAGYVIIWTEEDCGFICWLDERKVGDMVYSRTKELISSWSRGLLRRF